MKRLNSIALFLVITLTSCSTQKTETLWVSGYKTDCDMGAGMGKCLNIAKTKNLEDAKWENFYDTIEGFTFQEGYFQKVKVTKKELDPQKVPADASTLQYSLVKVLEKKEDFRNPLSGKWTLVAINNKAIVTTENIPELNFDIAKNRIYGTDGCNNYSAEIKNITSNDIQFGTISNTRKMCANMTLPVDYNHALLNVKKYKKENDVLLLFDENNTKTLRFVSAKQ